MARLLKNKDIKVTVVTNGISAAVELKENPNIHVILIGGILSKGSMAVEGTLGTNILNKINIDKMFASASGFTIEDGMTDFSVYEVELKKIMAEKVNKIIALLDSSKIGTSSIASFATIDQIDTIITDGKLSEEMVHELTARNIKIL